MRRSHAEDESVPDEEHEPRVVELSDPTADTVFSALSGSTAREILQLLNEQPRTMSELAAELDTSVQNVDYHMQKLIDADLVHVVDTRYSAKQTEMKVYAARNTTIALYGNHPAIEYLRDFLREVLGIVLLLGVATVVLYVALISWLDEPDTPDLGPGDGSPVSDHGDIFLDPLFLLLLAGVGLLIVALIVIKLVLRIRYERRHTRAR